MDHEAWENQMIESFDRREEETPKKTVKSTWSMVMSKDDARTVVRGLKRTLLALLTILVFVASIAGFIAAATQPGYKAVGLFFASILGIVGGFILLYAQGITGKKDAESQGESK